MKVQVKKKNYGGTVVIPSSKSDGQRAVLAAGLSKGITKLSGIGTSNDEVQMVKNIEQLGAQIDWISDTEANVKGIQKFPENVELSAGESGLGVRLMTSVLAAHKGKFQINGEGSLLLRPQTFFEEHLPQMGATVESNEGKLPMSIIGPLEGGEMKVDGTMSSQFLSGLLMALPLAEKDSVLDVNDLKSSPYVQMTLDTLSRFGIQIEHDNFKEFRISGSQTYECDSYQIEADWSSASYWIVAAAIGEDVLIKGLDQESLQADKSILLALQNANCSVEIENGTMRINGMNRRAFEFDATDCPDLFPALVSLAAFCDGKSVFKGVHRLKNKESDRGIALQSEFGKLGLQVDLNGDEMVVHGGTKLSSSTVDAHNDHRIAMCLAIAGMQMDEGLEITGAESVAKSYPKFWEHLTALER